jgi:hypothetical protein
MAVFGRRDSAPQHRIHPYLLRRLAIDRPNATVQIVRLHHLGRLKDGSIGPERSLPPRF